MHDVGFGMSHFRQLFDVYVFNNLQERTNVGLNDVFFLITASYNKYQIKRRCILLP